MSIDIIQEDIVNYAETKMGDEKVVPTPLLMSIILKVSETFGKIQSMTDISILLCCTLIVIGFSQMFSIIFDSSSGFIGLDSLSYLITAFTSTIGIFEVVLDSDVVLWNYVAVFSCTIFLLLYLILFLVTMCSKGVPQTALLKTLPLLSVALYWVLFIPIGKLLFSVYDCTDGIVKFDKGISCWSKSHIVWMVFLSIPILLLSALAFMIAAFGNGTNPYCTTSPFSRFDWGFEELFWIYRIYIICISVFVPKGTIRSSILIWSFCLGSIRFVMLYRRSYPYFNRIIAIVFGIACHSMLWISFIVLVKEIIGNYLNYKYEGESVLITAGIACTIKMVIDLYDNQFYYLLLNYREVDIKTEDEFNQFITPIIVILSTNEPIEFDNTMLRGYLLTHRNSCRIANCPLNNTTLLNNSKKFSKSNVFTSKELLIHLIQTIYRNCLEVNNDTGLIETGTKTYIWQRSLLSYTHFLIHMIGNLNAAVIELRRIELSKPSLTIRSAIHCIKHELMALHEMQNSKKIAIDKGELCIMDPRLLLEYEAKFGHFKDKLFKIAGIYREMWIQLISPFPDLNIVEDILTKIATENSEAREIRHQLNLLYPNYDKAEVVYAMYLSDVLGQEELAEKYLESCGYADASLASNFENSKVVFDSDTVVIVISAMFESLGNIIKASSGVSKLFEYSANELIGKNLYIIMPQLIGERHNAYLTSYLASGRRRVIDKPFNTFASDKQQYLFQIKLLIREYYDLSYQSIFVAMLTAYQSQSFILTSIEGNILGFSRNASREFGTTFSPVFIKEYMVKIRYLIPELDWDSENAKGTYESLIGDRKVVFMMPPNLNKVLQSLHGKRNSIVGRSVNSIVETLDYVNATKKIWKCAIVNICYQDLKLKAILFKPYSSNAHSNGTIYGRIDRDLKMIEGDLFESKVIKKVEEEKELVKKVSKDLESKVGQEKKPESEISLDQEPNLIKMPTVSRKILLSEIEMLKVVEYKKYVPSMVKWILRSGFLCLVVCVAVTLLYLVYILITIDSIERDFDIIELERESAILEITEVVNTFLMSIDFLSSGPLIDLTTRDVYDFNTPIMNSCKKCDYTEWSYTRLYHYANVLIELQDFTNKKVLDLYKNSTKESLNPSTVTMHISIGESINVNFNTLISTFASQAIKIAQLPLANITIENPAVAFILLNSYNGLLNLSFESGQILDEVTYIQSKSNLVALMAMFSVLGASTLLGFVLAYMWRALAHQSILNIQLLLKIASRELRNQIGLCGKFMRFISTSENEEHEFGEVEDLNETENGTNIEKVTAQEDEKRQLKQKKKSKRGIKRYNGYSSSIIALIVMYVAIVFGAVAYYLLMYLYTKYFNDNTLAHLEELVMLRYEYKSRSRLYALVIGTFRSLYRDKYAYNGSAALTTLAFEIPTMEDNLLNHYNKNKKYYADYYVSAFKGVMQGNLCNNVFMTDNEECYKLSGGILKNGLCVTNAYYIKAYQDMLVDISFSVMDNNLIQLIKDYINGYEFIASEVELKKYHMLVTFTMMLFLGKSFNEIKDTGKIVVIFLAVLACSFVVFIFFVIWKLYLNFLRERYLKSRTILCQIPLSIISGAPDISKYFLNTDKEILTNLSKRDITLLT